MSDEIKEILEFDFETQGERIEINEYERNKIKDYIINLQQENKQLKEQLENDIDRYEDTISYQLGFDKGKEYLQQRIDKAIENCKKSIESINQKLQDDKTIKVVDGEVVNMNEYQIVRLKAIRMKCKELLEILGDKE